MRFNLIDVGSVGTSEIWKKDYVNHIMTFDPMDINGKKSLPYHTGKRFHYPIAIFDTAGERSFYCCKKPQVSSLFKPNIKILKFHFGKNASRFNIIKIIKVICRRLDDVIRETGIKFDFLKVDAQGTDLNVLKSVGDLLLDFKGIQIECNHISYYENSPMADDIDIFLKDKGFDCVRKLFYKKYRTKKVLWNDYLYINTNASLEEKNFIIDVYTSKIFI